MTRVALARWGNNLAIRLPKATVQALGVSDGAEISLRVEDGALIAKPIRTRPRLEDLVRKITPRNVHKATDWRQPVGREAW